MIAILAQIYINTIRRITTFWMRNSVKMKMNDMDKIMIANEIADLKMKTKTTLDVVKELKSFKWVSDPIGGLLDWSPDIECFLYNKKEDDCDGAAYYTKWLFDIIGKESHIYSLISEKPFLTKSHVICVVLELDNKWMIFSNGYQYKERFATIEEAMKFYIQTNNKTLEGKDFNYYDFYCEINY